MNQTEYTQRVVANSERRWLFKSFCNNEENEMMKLLILSCVGLVLLTFSACSHKAIQETYWNAGTYVAHDEEKKGNIKKAETELIVALQRAKRELDDEQIASSLLNLGAFYRRQDRTSEAIHYLTEALKLEEKVSGPVSERTGRKLAELSAAYAMEGNTFEGRQYANRLKPLAKYYSGSEALFVNKVIETYAVDTEKYNKDVAELKPLADKGDPEAQYKLASAYFDGPDAKEKLTEILSLYETAANQGFADAQYYLGVLYDKGRGVKNNDEKAREWYKIAADNNHSIAQFNYAVFLMQGRGGPKNEEEAWSWMKKSSVQGYPAAQRILSKNKK